MTTAITHDPDTSDLGTRFNDRLASWRTRASLDVTEDFEPPPWKFSPSHEDSSSSCVLETPPIDFTAVTQVDPSPERLGDPLVRFRASLLQRLKTHFREEDEDRTAEGEVLPDRRAVKECLAIASDIAPVLIDGAGVRCAAFGEPESGASVVLQSTRPARRVCYKVDARATLIRILRVDELGSTEVNSVLLNERWHLRKAALWVTGRG